MPELHENDLRDVFRSAGRSAPVRDLTDRIMARVAVTPIAKRVAVEPVIGKRAWIVITSALIGVLTVLLFSSNPGAGYAWPWLGSALDRLGHIQLPKGNWPIWLALGSACALLFSYLDRILADARAHH